jgi:hypothetical protein
MIDPVICQSHPLGETRNASPLWDHRRELLLTITVNKVINEPY